MKRDEINEAMQQIKAENSQIFKILNENARRRLLRRGNIIKFVRAMARYIFDSRKKERRALKRLRSLLAAVSKGDWMKLELLYAYYGEKQAARNGSKDYDSAAALSGKRV